MRRLLGLMMVASVLVVIPAGAAHALTDPTTTDDQAGSSPAETSLREAIAEANTDAGDSVINLQPGDLYVLDICDEGGMDNAFGDLNHDPEDDAALTINGNGATIRQTCPGYRVLRDRSSGQLTLNNVTITGGAEDGSGGGVKSDGPVLISNSTISGNTADGDGGGIYSFDDVTLSHATVVNNSGSLGGNILANELESFGSVVANPSVGDNCYVGATTSSGYNYADDQSCGFSAGTDTEDDGGDPLLGPLTDGVHVPMAVSPLVDAIASADCSVLEDQRGVVRPQGNGCDIGAVEVEVFDSDGDGVSDGEDLCSDTVLPDAPTKRLKGARFAAQESGTFDSGRDRFDGMYTLADTYGCSGTQIIAIEGLGNGHTKYGISKGALEAFIAGLNGG